MHCPTLNSSEPGANQRAQLSAAAGRDRSRASRWSAAAATLSLALLGVANAQILKGTGFIYGPPMQGSSELGLNGDVTAKHALAVDSAGNAYITGSAFLGGVGNDWLTVKYNTLGVEQWRATLNGRANSATADEARSVRLSTDDNIVVTGSSSVAGGTNARRCTVAKYDSATGKEIWRALPGPPSASPAWSETLCFAAAIDSSGNIIVTGRAREQFNFGNSDIYVAKFNSNGGLIWHKALGPSGAYAPAVVPPATISAGSDDLAAFVTVDSSGNAYIAARTQETATNYVWRIFKLDGTGAQLWRADVGGSGDSRPRAIAINGAATHLAVAGTIDGKAGYSLHDTSTGSVLSSGGASGATIGAASSTGALSDVTFLPGSSDFIVAGTELIAGGTLAYAAIARIGVTAWQNSYGNGANTRWAFNAITLTSGGAELAVTGIVGTLPAASGDADLDIRTGRIDVTTGGFVSAVVDYQGPAQTSFAAPARDFGSAIGVDSNGRSTSPARWLTTPHSPTT